MGKLMAKLARVLEAQLGQTPTKPTIPAERALVSSPRDIAPPSLDSVRSTAVRRTSTAHHSGDLFSLENLLRAWRKVRANGGGAGVDGQTLQDFGANERENLKALREELLTGNYKPPPVRVVYVQT